MPRNKKIYEFPIDINKPIELEDFNWDGEHSVQSWDSLDEIVSTSLNEYIILLENLRLKYLRYNEIGYLETLKKLFPYKAYIGKGK
jgi:hypothetical protein